MIYYIWFIILALLALDFLSITCSLGSLAVSGLLDRKVGEFKLLYDVFITLILVDLVEMGDTYVPEPIDLSEGTLL
jgi:hypothetical protein